MSASAERLAGGADWESQIWRCASSWSRSLALFAARMRGENFAAQLAEVREPRTQICGQLLVDFAAQPLRDGGAFAGGRDGDLQIAAADDRAEEEIAVGNVVDAVARGCRAPDAPRDRRRHSLQDRRWRQ